MYLCCIIAMPGRTLSPWNQSIVWACDGLASPGSNAPVEVSSTMIMHSFSILNKELTLSVPWTYDSPKPTPVFTISSGMMSPNQITNL